MISQERADACIEDDARELARLYIVQGEFGRAESLLEELAVALDHLPSTDQTP